MKKLFFFILVCSINKSAKAQSALEFWLAPPDVTDLHNIPGGEPIYLMLVPTSGNIATVTISMPANGSFIPIIKTVYPGTPVRVNLTPFKAVLETRPTNTIANSGLYIQSNQPVSAGYEVTNTNNIDLISLKGNEAMGNYFYIPLHKYSPFLNEASFSAPHQAFSSFDIVASENGTEVRIYSPVTVDGHPVNQQFIITLNKGQTYSCAYTGTNWQLPANHPSGAVILSNKPVAVSIKGDSEHNPSGGCYDLQMEQLVPVNKLGNDHIAIKGSLNNTGDESVFIMAVVNGTEIYIDGAATPVTKMFAGEVYRIDLDYLNSSTDNSTFIHATQPVYAIQYSGFGCEMGDALLPPVSAGNGSISVVRNDAQTFYLMLACRTVNKGNFTTTINGTATISPLSFIIVPGTGGLYSAARIQYNTTQFPVDSLLTIQNTGGFLAGVLNGGASSGAMFSYFNSYAPGNILPLRSLNLSGTAITGFNKLEWKAGEDGNAYTYELQQKQDGAWKTIYSSSGNGWQGDKTYYYDQPSFQNGTFFYRVMATELNSRLVRYSNVTALLRADNYHIQVHPNPASKTLVVSITGNFQKREISLYSADGRLVQQTITDLNTVTLSLKNVPAGTYLLKVKDGDSVSTQKVIVN